MVSAAVSDASRPLFVTTYGYDANGSQVVRERPGHAKAHYEFNGYERLVTVEQPGAAPERYAYDPQGRRATVTRGNGNAGSARRYLHGGDASILAEVDNAGRVVRRYVRTPAGALVLAVDVYSGAPLFFHFDALGNVVAQSDKMGKVGSRSVYDAYGALLGGQPVSGAFGFIGRAGVEEDGTGLKMMGLREYDPATGRFLSADPYVRYGLPVPRYAYVHNDPVNLTDPLGLGYPINPVSPLDVWGFVEAEASGMSRVGAEMAKVGGVGAARAAVNAAQVGIAATSGLAAAAEMSRRLAKATCDPGTKAALEDLATTLDYLDLGVEIIIEDPLLVAAKYVGSKYLNELDAYLARAMQELEAGPGNPTPDPGASGSGGSNSIGDWPVKSDSIDTSGTPKQDIFI
jgi:RHS repeat-associated protein